MKIAMMQIVNGVPVDDEVLSEFDYKNTLIKCDGRVLATVKVRTKPTSASLLFPLVRGMREILESWNNNRKMHCFMDTKSHAELNSDMVTLVLQHINMKMTVGEFTKMVKDMKTKPITR